MIRIGLVYFLLTFLTISCSTNQETTDTDRDTGLVTVGGGIDLSDIETKDIDQDGKNKIFTFRNNEKSSMSTIYFSYDSDVLSSEAQKKIKSNARWILKNQDNLSKIELEGHCDPVGSEAYNIGLGLRRAQAVKDVLVSLGVPENKLSVISYGEERPISTEDYSLNRRVHLVAI